MRRTPSLSLLGPSPLLLLAACAGVGESDSTSPDTRSASDSWPMDEETLLDGDIDPEDQLVFGEGADIDGDNYATSLDCDDGNASINPGATETDNLVDEDCDGFVDEDFVAAGDVIFNEVVRQARFGGTAAVYDGSWVEIHNTSTRSVDLSNWTFRRSLGAQVNSIVFDPSAAPILAPGGYAVLCDTDNYEGSSVSNPLNCDYVWGDETQPSTYKGSYHDNTFFLRVNDDTLGLYVGGTSGTLIDQVRWTYDSTNGYWPRVARYAIGLDASYRDATLNDDETYWCSATADASGVVSPSDPYRWYDTTGTTRDEYGLPNKQNYDCQFEVDHDGDGYTSSSDCNDNDASINPGAAELCDGLDNDCDGTPDDGAGGTTTYYPDADSDGYGDVSAPITACAQPPGYVLDGTDCDDTSGSNRPGGTEVCDGEDNDCDSSIDEGITSGSNTFYLDADADGYGTADSTTLACTAPSGYSSDDTDCDDADGGVNPGASEVDNLADDDCDDYVDEDFIVAGDLVISEVNRQARFGGTTTVVDGSWVEVTNVSARTVDLSNMTIARGTLSTDNQVALDPSFAPVLAPGERAVFCDTDNYEASAAAYPLSCDYVWGDETQASTYKGTYHDNTFYLRANSDRFAVYSGGNRSTGTLIDRVTWYYDATNGYWPRVARFSMSLDPAAVDATLNDNLDSWCSTTESAAGTTANNSSWAWYDTSATSNDEHGTPGAANYDCPLDGDLDGDGYTGADDCDETEPTVNVFATEICDGLDNDCNILIDDDAIDADTWYADFDADGYGDPLDSVLSCAQPDIYVADDTDCDDAATAVNPGATEACDGIDNDCDTLVDEPGATGGSSYYTDGDGDSYGDPATGTTLCAIEAGYSADNTDCDDTLASVNPGASELCDGLDNDCDTVIDDGAPTTTYYGDADADGYGDASVTIAACGAPGGYVADSSDCDDADGAVNPGATEVCNDGTDQNCLTDCAWDGEQTAKAAYDMRFYGTSANWSVGTSIANNGDFNGDGYDDAVMGAAFMDNTVTDQGAFYLYYGPVSSSEDISTYDVRAWGSSAQAQDFLGSSVRFAGDVDGDGKDDLLVSAWKSGTSDAGTTYLFLGGTNPTSVSDAFASFTTSSGGSWMGQAIDGADLDGDGKAEVLVSAYNRSSGTGALALWNATAIGGGAEDLATTSTFVITGAASGDNLGYDAKLIDDISGDGVKDLLVGAPAASSTTAAGKAYYWDDVETLSGALATSTADASFAGSAAQDRFGLAVAGLGDTDGDGHNEFVITADKNDGAATDAGAAYIWDSTPAGSVALSSASTTLRGEFTSDYFGRTAAGLGDIDSDGLDDFAIGATAYDEPSYGDGAGAIYLFYGPAPTGTVSAGGFDALFTGANTSDAVGYAVAGGGDVNNDGWSDFMLASTSWDSFGLLNAGAAWVYYGRSE